MNSLYQSTSHILMVRPVCFGFNSETVSSNSFQQYTAFNADEIAIRARKEFDNAVIKLKQAGINVNVADDNLNPVKPDAVFPNNWISFAHDGTAYVFPMCASNRQAEVRVEIIDTLRLKYQIKQIIDLREFAAHRYLEGTGSIVFDHIHRIAYASLSERTNDALLDKFCNMAGYDKFIFHSYDKQQNPIYHTNVLMSIASTFAVICLGAIPDGSERSMLENKIRNSGREIIEISMEQMANYAGNMIGLSNDKNETLIVMSAKAEKSLSSVQKKEIMKYANIITLDIPTIETVGGGSARCMIAEIFCPPFQ